MTLALELRPDVVLMDIRMPELDSLLAPTATRNLITRFVLPQGPLPLEMPARPCRHSSASDR